MPLDKIIHEMNEVIQEYNLLQFRMTDLGSRLSGLHAKVSYYLNTRKDLHEDQIQPTTRNNGEIQHDGVQTDITGNAGNPEYTSQQ